MKKGDQVTAIIPLGNRTDTNRSVMGRYMAKRGVYLGWTDDRRFRILGLPDGGQYHLSRHQGVRLTTKPVNISPCGLKE